MRKFRVGSILLGTILMITVKSNAYTVDLSANENRITAGSKIVVSAKLQKLEDEIDVYHGKLEYDRKYFNEITENDFIMKNGWDGLVFNKDNGKFIIENDKKTNKEQEVFQITLETKADLKCDNINISIKDSVASGGQKDIESQDVDLKIDVIQKDIDYGYPVENNVLIRVKPQTPIDEFKKIINKSLECTVKVSLDGIEVNSGYVKTGMKAEIEGNEEKVEYEISVIGDTNGDGISNALDSQMIKAHRNEIITLTGAKYYSADLDNNTTIDLKDSKLLLYHRADVKEYDLNYVN